jgi:hypothetical protein
VDLLRSLLAVFQLKSLEELRQMAAEIEEKIRDGDKSRELSGKLLILRFIIGVKS